MNDDHEPTEFAECREKAIAADKSHEDTMKRLAPGALVELLSRKDCTIYSHTDDMQGSVQVVRKGPAPQYVVKSYTGWRSALVDEETHSLIRASDEGLQQVIGYTRIETAAQGLAGTNKTITMPYVGLDLEKWESLFHKDDAHNPFLRVSFHLKLAISMLTALHGFHEKNFLHCDIKLNNWCIAGQVPEFPTAGGESPIHLFGQMNLSDLTLIDLAFAMTDLPSGRKLIKRNGNCIAVEGDYVAESYRRAVQLAGSTGDFTHLASISWRADLFSLGELFEKLLDSYGSRLVSDTGESHLQFLRSLPDRLRSYEKNPASSVSGYPHPTLITQIHLINPLTLNQGFGILVGPEDVPALKKALPTGDLMNLGQADSSNQSGTQSEIGEIRRQTRSWFRSTAMPATLIASMFVVWALLSRTPSPTPLQPAVPVMAPARHDSVFVRCDDLRVNAIAGKALSRQDYSIAIGRCSEFLQLKNAPPELRFDALITRAVALEKSDRWHEALEDLKLAEALNPKDPGVDLNRSLVLSRQGKVQQAFASLDSAIDKGWRDGPLIEKDTDYDAITKSPLYQSIRIRLSSPK